MTSENAGGSGSIPNVETIDDKKRIAQLEHEIFTVCKQLDEKSEKLKEVQQQNALLKERASTLEKDKLDRSNFVESVVQSRDNLIFEKTQLQNDKLALEQRKGELEMQISKFTNDKRHEIEQLRNLCDTLRTDKIQLQAQIDDFQCEKAALAYDKEQWSQEKHILLSSKQWYMDEISNREQKVNELRIQNIREKSELQREIAFLNEKNSELSLNATRTSKALQEREAEFAELKEKMKNVLEENSTQISELEAELRTRERLTKVYKDSMEKADLELSEARDNEFRLDELVKEKEEALLAMSSELQEAKEVHEKILKEKDDELKRLSEEVTKSTELLNAGFRLNRPDEDIARISPAAAAASSLLKSGMSLTGIYAEHCRVVSELEKKNTEFSSLEKYVTELIQDLDSRAPKFLEQRKAYDQLSERNECLQLQKDLLSSERQKLQFKSDSLTRELTFTKRELERYQREHNIQQKQIQRFLYLFEKGSLSYNDSLLNESIADDDYLFANIGELQSKNIQLAEEVERLRGEQDKAIENYHNTEIELLKQSRNQLQEELSRLKENFSKQSTLVQELTMQRDQYKKLYDQLNNANSNGMSSNESTASESTQPNLIQQPTIKSLQMEIMMWKTKSERLQETNIFLNEDRQSHEKILNDRLDQQLEQISTMRTTIGKLESDLEFQNKNQQLLAKQIDSYSHDLNRLNNQLSESKRQVESLEIRNDSLTNQLLEKQQRLSTLEVQNHSLSEERAVLTSRDQRLQAELEILRQNRYSTERVSTSIQEMELLLKRMEAEKSHSMDSQLQSALLERDNFRQLIDSLNEQNNQLVNGLKNSLNVASSERDKAQADAKSIQTHTNLEACKKEIQKMKNTIAYQEKQIAEFENKCEELNGAIERKDKQLEEMCRLGTNMEGTIQFGNVERQRMQAIREQLEEEMNKNKLLIEDLRNAVSIKEMELLSQTKNLTETNNKLDELNAKTEQWIVEKDKETHEYKRVIDQLRLENEKLQSDFERVNSNCTDFSENNLRLTTDLAKEISKSETLTQQIATLEKDCQDKCEKFQKSIDIFEQEKLRLQDEINTYMTRDKEHLEKQASLYDEIQELLKRIEFMERLQHTIASPSPNTSLNVSATMSTFSPISRLSTTGIEASTQQHTERINAIIGYMRTDKQKETELRMSAELELQRIRAKSTVDQQKILQLESEIAKLTNEVEINAKIAVEKEELLTQLNSLREVQNRYQQIKKSFDELNERFTSTNVLAQGLEVEQAKLLAEKTELNSKLENVTKLSNGRAQQIKLLKERYDRAMAMASKYSPEIVNSLQGDNEKLKLDITQKENDIGILRKECDRLTEELKKIKVGRDEHNTLTAEYTKATATHKAAHESHLMVKQVARKIREEKIKLSEENGKLQDELKAVQDQLVKTRDSVAAAAAGSSNAEAVSAIQAERKEYQTKIEELTKKIEASTQQIKELETQRDELLIKIENQQRDIEDAAEKVMRIEMVEKAYKNSQEKIRQLGTEIKQLKEENEQLKASEIGEGIIDIDDIPVAAATEPASSADPPVKPPPVEQQQQIEYQLLEKAQDLASAEFPIQTGTDGLNELSSGENIPVSYDGNKQEEEAGFYEEKGEEGGEDCDDVDEIVEDEEQEIFDEEGGEIGDDEFEVGDEEVEDEEVDVEEVGEDNMGHNFEIEGPPRKQRKMKARQ
uniref:Nucleoprotein TPR n=1 Tax=Meloidogyne javanica TaxID=6303 RepID=A0A915M9A7_MELJA